MHFLVFVSTLPPTIPTNWPSWTPECPSAWCVRPCGCTPPSAGRTLRVPRVPRARPGPSGSRPRRRSAPGSRSPWSTGRGSELKKKQKIKQPFFSSSSSLLRTTLNVFICLVIFFFLFPTTMSTLPTNFFVPDQIFRAWPTWHIILFCTTSTPNQFIHVFLNWTQSTYPTKNLPEFSWPKYRSKEKRLPTRPTTTYPTDLRQASCL